MNSDDLCYTPAVVLARLIRERELSPTELLEAFFRRIERVNPAINAYCTVAYDRARAEARGAEAAVMSGEPLGPIHGVPVSIKDITATAGVRTTMGSKIFEHNVPHDDAIVVQRVRAAGGVMIGKTNTPEFGCKGVTDNRIFGATRNPWNRDMVAGGSTGGAAAAVAAGLGPLAQGTDLAGSVRIPAAACGVVGLKPSPGRIPRAPGLNAWNTLAVDGPLARTVRDTALLFNAAVGPDRFDPISLPFTGEDFVAECDRPLGSPRIAWSADLGYAPVEPEISRIAESAAGTFVDLGAGLQSDHPAFADPDNLFRRLTGAARSVAFRKYLDEWADQMDPILIERMHMTDSMSADDLERLNQERTLLWIIVARFFERYDLLLTPTLAMAPFPIANAYPPTSVADQAVNTPTAWFPFTFPFNLTGNPAITVPAGWTESGLPVGLQIVARRNEEALLFRAAAAFEAARPWAQRRPEL
jgi:Asp-tRNA(Asn)/Glu-tRNA(Gln) amidotransferase A subunit family amidase